MFPPEINTDNYSDHLPANQFNMLIQSSTFDNFSLNGNITEDIFCNLTAKVDISPCLSGSEYLASIVLNLVGLGCNNTNMRMVKITQVERMFIQTVIRDKVDELRAAERPLLIPLTIMFALIAFAGMIGNLCVLYIFSRKMALTNLTYFVVTLAVVDLLTCIVVIPGTAAQAWYTAFNNDGLCKAWQLIRYSILFAPSFLLVAVAMERYILICHPTLTIVSSRCLRLCLAAALTTGFMLGIPPMLSAGTYVLIKDTDIMVHLGLCVNNYILISRQAVGHYWIAISIMYATFSVSLALLYGLIFRYLYRRRHRWQQRTVIPVQPTETVHIMESDTSLRSSKTNLEEKGGILSNLRNIRKVSFSHRNTTGAITRKSSIFDGKDRTLMFRNHSMYPDYVNNLNARREEIMQRDNFMSEGELAAIINDPYSLPRTKRHREKLIPRESTITSVTSLPTEFTEVSNEFSQITAPNQTGLQRIEDEHSCSSSTAPNAFAMAHPNVPLESCPSITNANGGKCTIRTVNSLDGDLEGDNERPTPKKQNEQSLSSGSTSSATSRKPVNDALVSVGISHEDIIPDPVASPTISAVNLQMVGPTTPSHLTPAYHTQISREGRHRSAWSSPHIKTAIVWFTVTVTFILAYTPMLLIQTRVIPPFANSRFLYFTFLFIAALNPIIYSVLNRTFTEVLCRLLPCNIFKRIFKCKAHNTTMESPSK